MKINIDRYHFNDWCIFLSEMLPMHKIHVFTYVHKYYVHACICCVAIPFLQQKECSCKNFAR